MDLDWGRRYVKKYGWGSLLLCVVSQLLMSLVGGVVLTLLVIPPIDATLIPFSFTVGTLFSAYGLARYTLPEP